MLGYLGPNGTFSHQAAMEWSEGKEEIKEFSTIYSVILAVEKGEIDRGRRFRYLCNQPDPGCCCQ